MSETLLVQHRSLPKGRMREESYLFTLTEVVDGLLVVEDMRLGLVDSGADLTEFEEAFELRRADVAHAETADLSLAVESLALLPHRVEGYVFVQRPPVEARAPERCVDVDEGLALACHRREQLMLFLQAPSDVPGLHAHRPRVRVANEHEVAQIFPSHLLRHARAVVEGAERRHRRTGVAAVPHAAALVVGVSVRARGFLEVFIQSSAAETDARQVAAAQVERVEKGFHLRFVGQLV